MRDNLLDAIVCAVRMVRGAYGWPEALSYAAIQYDLDEFEREDLEVCARSQYARLKKQTGGHNG
jgi:hypothetical protein